jgi:hypothetical protein
MTVTVKHSKTNAISDWTQAQLDEQIELGNFAPGTTLADIVLPSDWNNDHTLTGLGTMAEQDATAVAITGGTINNTTIGATTATTGVFTGLSSNGVTSFTNGSTNLTFTDGGGTVNPLYLIGQTTGLGRNRIHSQPQLRLTTNNNPIQFHTGAGTAAASDGNVQFVVSHTTSAVNYVQATGGATSNSPVISAQGSDAAVALSITSKGTNAIRFLSNNAANLQFRIVGTNTAVNNLAVTGTIATNAPSLSSEGTDTNISMAFQPKGTGAIDLAAGSSGVNISNGGTVTAITRTGNGTGYTSFPSVAITAPTTAGGVQAVASLTNMQSIGASISAGGTGYAVGNVITISGGTPVTVAATFTVSAVSSGVVTAVTALNFAPYTVLPTAPVSTTGGAGTGLTLTNLTWAIGSSFTISNAGSGYIEQPTVTFSGGGGSGAAAYASVGSTPIVKSIASTLSFNNSAGEALRLNNANFSTLTDYVEVRGGASVAGAYLTVGGSTTNANLYESSKGTGNIQFYSNSFGQEQFRVSHTASAVNYVQVTGAATLNPPVISAQGSDSTVALLFQAKGGQNIRFYSSAGSAEQFRILHTGGTIANYCSVTGNVAGSAPAFSVNGSDTNIDLALTPKGTGLVRFGTYVAGALTATGYINIKAADGTTYKVLVST